MSTQPRRTCSCWALILSAAIFIIICIIIFPYFAQIRDKDGDRASCQNNLKQYTAAMVQYVTDADGRYPTRYIGTIGDAIRPDRNPGRPGWIHNALRPNLKNDQVLACPQAPGTTGTWPAAWDKNGKNVQNNSAYAGYTYNYARMTNATDKDIELPAETAMMWDSMNNFLDEQGQDVPCGADGRCGTIVGALKNGSVNVKLAFQKFISSKSDLYRFCSEEPKNNAWISKWSPSQPNPDERKLVMWHQFKGNIAWVDGHVSSGNFDTLYWKNIFKLNKKLAGECYSAKPIAQCDINPLAIKQ